MNLGKVLLGSCFLMLLFSVSCITFDGEQGSASNDGQRTPPDKKGPDTRPDGKGGAEKGPKPTQESLERAMSDAIKNPKDKQIQEVLLQQLQREGNAE